MNQDVIPPQRRSSGAAPRAIRALLTVVALTGLGLSLGACDLMFCDYPGAYCQCSECGK